MKKIFNLIAIAAVFGSALAGCNVLTEDGVYAGKKEINFSATVGTYQVKATDTAFEDGDAIGLFADDPIYVENVKLNFSKGKLTPEAPVYWGEQQLLEQPTYFSAYYPYVTNSAFVDKEYGYRSIYFAVAEDQTTHEAMTASDFMVAKAQSSPADGTVQLHFAHAFSKIIFTVDNQINDNKVVNITLGGVCLGAWAHVEDIGASWGDYDRQGTIKMAPVTTAAGEPAWAAILPPQSVYPVVFIEMEDGDQYTYNTDEEVYFGPSRRYNASIVIDQTSVSADFSSDISDWVDSGEIPFGQYVDAGNWYCQTSSDVYWMEHDGKAVRHADINYYSGSVLHFVKELENWETEHYGLAEENITVEEGYTYQIVKNGNEFSLPMEGYWRLTIVPEQGTLVAEYRGAFENWNEGWSLIGTIYDTYWDTDFSMEQYGDFAVFTLDYVEGQEFKFRRYAAWEENRGIGDVWPFVAEDRVMYEMLSGGANITLPWSGTWEITCNFKENIVFFAYQPGYVLDDLQEIVLLPAGKDVPTFTQVVYAVSTRGFQLYDGKYSIFVYTGDVPEVQVGDVVTVESSSKAILYTVPAVQNPAWSVVSHVSADQMEDLNYRYEDATGYLDEYGPSISVPVMVEGVLGEDGRTVTVDGMTVTATAIFVPDNFGLDNLAGHYVRLCGFFAGFHSELNSVLIILTEVYALDV